jgi:hypothetical protein
MHASVRPMQHKDITAVIKLGCIYTEDELTEWLECSENIMLVCAVDSLIQGFAICFIMSSYRVILDQLVCPENIELKMNAAIEELCTRKSIVVAANHPLHKLNYQVIE